MELEPGCADWEERVRASFARQGAPARGDRLVAGGEVVRRGRTLTTCLVRVEAFEGGTATPCALMLQTVMAVGPR